MLTRLRHLLVGMTRPIHSRLTYTYRRGRAAELRRRGGFGFIGRSARWSPEERYLKSSETSLIGRTVFNIEGETGMFAPIFGRVVGPTERVKVFGPNPGQPAEIRRNLALNGFRHFTVNQAEEGPEDGRVMLQFSNWRQRTGSWLRPPDDGGTCTRVEVVCPDRLVSARRLLPPNMVKIAVEGADLLLLQGMKDILQQQHARLLIDVHCYGPDGRNATRQSVEFLLGTDSQISHLESYRVVTSVDEAE